MNPLAELDGKNDLGWQLLNIIAEFFEHADGPDKGKQFLPSLDQARKLVELFENDRVQPARKGTKND